MEYVIDSQKIEEKLAKRGITLEHIYQCFQNKVGRALHETRPQHQTIPPTLWFIARTDADRLLKIVFMYYATSQEVHIKSAYDPSPEDIERYERDC
jgi:uncharacterized DUF497 family protein